MIDQRIEMPLLNAAIARCEADRQAAIAELGVYLRNPVAIGEHPNFLEEIDKLLGKAAHADEKLELINKIFGPKQAQVNDITEG
jgi:hypothetical protein